MRVRLPEGYVPPEPTHPRYGYLTPEELAAYEEQERSGPEIVPEAPAPGSDEAASALAEAVVDTSGQPARGWVPPAPLAEPAPPEYRWDAYQQQWVATSGSVQEIGESDAAAQPPPDHAAAAGGRGAATSWTSADGQRFRWDARTQRWIVEAARPPEPSA